MVIMPFLFYNVYLSLFLYLKNRKTILTILALLFLVGPFISTSYFIIKKEDLKNRFFKRFEDKKVHTIELNKDEIVWESKNREIIINNRLFDVKSITYQNNKAIITGWYDNEEENINIAINKEHQKSKRENNTVPFFSYIFCEQIIYFKIEKWNNIDGKKYFTTNDSAYDIALQIFLPPPRV
jgi:hypothetical protein